MRISSSIAGVAALIGATTVAAAPAAAAPTQKCNADLVLRLLKGKGDQATSFCSTYTTTPATVGQAYPTWASSYTTATSRLSSACTCLMAEATGTAAPQPIICNADNVLRMYRGKSSSASAFCSTYTTAPVTAGQAYPTWLSKEYIPSTSRLSSACTCLNGPATSVSQTELYTPPVPTHTADPIQAPVTRDPPGITGAPIPLVTGSVADNIPPKENKDVFYANLGEDEETALIAHVNFQALAGAPLVNIDDLIPGLDGFPTCGASTITLKFQSTANRNLAVTQWGSKTFTLMTAGAPYCGTVSEHNFFKVSSVAASGSNSIILAVTKVAIEEAVEIFDASYGTFNMTEGVSNKLRRDLQKRIELDIGAVFNQIWNFIKGGGTKRWTTPSYHYDFTIHNLYQLTTDSGTAAVSCDYCGIDGAVEIFGQISFNILKKKALGLVLGFDLVNPVFNLDMGVSWKFRWQDSIEVPIFAVVPFGIEIPNLLTIAPKAELIAAFEFDIRSAFQIRHIGFNGRWGRLSFGYNVLTRLPVIDGNFIPQMTFLEPKFNNDVSLYGEQDAKVTMWVGPRVGMDVDVFSGALHGDADVTFQFPAISIEAKLDSLSKCPGASGKDMCVDVYSDARIRGTAQANAGFAGVWENGVEAELFNYKLGTIVDQHFKIDI